MDSSSTEGAPCASKPAQEAEPMVVDKSLESPAEAPKEEYQLTGKSAELVAEMRKSLEKSRKTEDDIIKSLVFKQEAQMLKLRLQKLKESIRGNEALAVLYDVKDTESDENSEL